MPSPTPFHRDSQTYKEKGFPDACGDFIAWRQLMEIAKEEKKGVILVIDDVKEDWWLLERGRTLGPRPELMEEFARVTEQRFYMYNSENFLRAAKEFTSAEIHDDVLEEVSQRFADNIEAMRAVLLKSIPIEIERAGAQKGSAAADLKQPAAVADSTPDVDKLIPPVD